MHVETDAMSASGKFDFSSGSPDRPIYASGHRGSYDATSLDRSGSFREDMETQLLSNLPNMTRSGSCVTKGDVLHFFHCLRFDPKSMVVEHKLNRPPEFKRFASAAIGVPMDDSLPTTSKSKQLSSPSLDDLRRLKSGAKECGTKARERVRIFSDCLSVVNKCFPSIPSRKRSRLDSFANDRSTGLSSIDRSMSRMGASKLGIQNYANTSGLDLQHHKSEEMTKPSPPSKRTRTSMIDDKMDVRSTTPARPSGTFNKDRGTIRLSNSISIHGEDRQSSIAVGCWENPKTKKKRTGIKPDASSSMTTKLVDGYWEPKQGIPRVSTEASPRLNDARGSRSGLSNGSVGAGRSDASLQIGSGIRLSVSRADSNNSSSLHERRERTTGQEKEVVDLKVLNKANSREDFSSGSPTSSPKLNAKVRAPRSSSISSVSKLSQTAQRSPSSNDWEVTNCTSKVPGVPGASNRKHKPTARPSSPSVASWAQRPQKISRTARKANLLPIVPGNEESPVADVTPDMVVNGSQFSANSPQQVKIKSDTFSSTTLSESEESGATEDKFQNKNKKGSEINEKSGQAVQKMSTLLPTRKKKTVSKDNHVDGIRRQGRTGRVVPSSRALIPVTVEKIGNVETTKQIRTSRLVSDKPERTGRPPTRKVSDRKSQSRQKNITLNETTNFLDVSDDGHEELLAATKAVTDMAEALSCPFWKKMEPLFRFICDADITYLKEQINLCSAIDLSVPALLDADSSTFLPNGSEFEREEIGMENVELSPELAVTGAKITNEISLYQRLVAALIPEGDEELFDVEKDVISYDLYGSRLHMEKNKETNGLVMSQDAGYDHMQNGLIVDWISGTACSEYQYNNMPINERLLLEIHSIGIYPDLAPDPAQSRDEETSENFCGLQEKYREQVLKKKSLHGKLLNSVSEAKELHGKEFEVRALDKLVATAYEKYMSCCGPNAQGVKSANGKLAQQAALAFVQRTLRRYHEFEATGKSCFDEPEYKNMFLSELSSFVDGIPLTCSNENESDKRHPRKSGCSMVVGTSAPLGTQQSPSSNNQEIYSSEMLVSPSMASETNTDKEDSWADRAKRKELLLDDVGGTIGMSPGVPSGVGGSLSCNAKGKRSERDRVGKGREASSRNGNAKIGRPASSTFKGQRKHKAKPKQAHLSASVNGTLGKMCDQPGGTKPNEITGIDIANESDEFNLDMLEEPIDLSGLQLPDMDFVGVANDINGQDGDIGSWLNFEDDGLQDQDFAGGLGIPTDDLANLDMMI